MFKLRLIDKRPETADVTTFVFEPETPIVWRAGQFIKYRLSHEGTDERGADRFFTIASAPHERHIYITTKFALAHGSTFKNALNELAIGDEVEAHRVGGDFVVSEPAKPRVFIAGGIGITPFRAIMLDLDYRGEPLNINLLYGNRTEDIPFRATLDELAARHSELKVNYLIDPERIDAAAIRKYVPDLMKPLYYVSGPEPMVEAIEKLLYGMGIPEGQVQRDYFPGYEDI